MRKVIRVLVLAVAATAFFACNDDKSKTEVQSTENDMAVVEKETTETVEFLYVTAPSGLSLREHGNLNSEKLAVMPYGTKVKIVTPETKETMTVAGIKGGMHEVEFNHKTGYAFNGYLSKFFPPEEDIKPKVYAEELKAQFSKVEYSESNGGTASSPTNTSTLKLPTKSWHEAFFIATELYGIPKHFAFPEPKGSPEETVADTKKPKDVTTSDLKVFRTNDALEKIEYDYQAKGYSYIITIQQNDDSMVLEKTEKTE
ncbi:SH3 domain-containing protein [Luteirhabdus pelagi]|uniref:SH3 domain-containing protein n=1 Tax=Luteirhabdus pelagi TaxID=2792783 RepID=UPI0019393012|nr:SH3 domain-containing protein [Luteirhabdus pelagi]